MGDRKRARSRSLATCRSALLRAALHSQHSATIRSRFDALITDERMPGIFGLGAGSAKCAASANPCPFLLMSGYLAATATQSHTADPRPTKSCRSRFSRARALAARAWARVLRP